MLKSMTGFGKCGNITGEYKISVETKAVSHRYLDLSVRMPEKLNCFKASIGTLLKKYIQGGKVDLFISYEDYTEGSLCLRYNRALAAEYMDYSSRMAEELDIQNDVKISILTKFPGVFSMEQVPDDEEHLWEILSVALEEATKMFVRPREARGKHLKKDLLGKLDHIASLMGYIEEHSPQVPEEYRAKLKSKVQGLLSTTVIDEGRVAAEVVISAGKICVGKETVRLRNHIENTKQELLSGEDIGRKLDFVAQEVNREVNTILSKSTDLPISDKAAAPKTKVEKIREQIQNIEQVDTIRALKSQGSIP